MKNITANHKITREASAGAKVYHCRWCNVKGTSFWKVYGHAVLCGIPHGYYSLPIDLFLKACGL